MNEEKLSLNGLIRSAGRGTGASHPGNCQDVILLTSVWHYLKWLYCTVKVTHCAMKTLSKCHCVMILVHVYHWEQRCVSPSLSKWTWTSGLNYSLNVGSFGCLSVRGVGKQLTIWWSNLMNQSFYLSESTDSVQFRTVILRSTNHCNHQWVSKAQGGM